MRIANINNKWPFVRGAIPFIGLGIVLTLFLLYVNFKFLALLFGLITAFIAFFFRDPNRKCQVKDKTILSPADGKLIEIDESKDYIKVGIFMSLTDVHINRIPVNGTIKDIKHIPGKFLRADLKEASLKNEKNRIILIPDGYSTPITIVQIAGIIARRIVCWIDKGDKVIAGQRFGLVCFGSRVELYLDKRCKIIVNLGQKVKAGITIIGYMP